MQNNLLGHEILNHLGIRIRVSARTLRRLDMENWLQRDRESGLLQFKPHLAQLYREMGVDNELGDDFSGPNVCECTCKECRERYADIDNTSMPGHKRPGVAVNADRIVADVKAKRRYAA